MVSAGGRLGARGRRARQISGFQITAKRWIVERTFGWLGMNRRLAMDYERKVQTSETLIEVAMIRLILRQLVGQV
jgi:putative transposase